VPLLRGRALQRGLAGAALAAVVAAWLVALGGRG